MATKTCPFCGSTDVGEMADRADHYVLCWDCKAQGPRDDNGNDSLDGWNRRSVEGPLLAACREALEWADEIPSSEAKERYVQRLKDAIIKAAGLSDYEADQLRRER